MCTTATPLSLFGEETQARINAGEHRVCFHRNGRWEVIFIEEGIYMYAALDANGVEHVEFLGDPRELPRCPLFGGECRHPGGVCSAQDIKEIEDRGTSGCAWL